MRFHRELREGALYALVVKEPEKLGPWMKPTNLNCESARETWLAKGERAPRLCSDLPRERRYGAPVHRWAGTVDSRLQDTLNSLAPRS